MTKQTHGAKAPVPSPRKPLELRVLQVKDRGSPPMAFRFMLDFEDRFNRKGWLQTDFPFEIGDTFSIFTEGGKTYIAFPRPHLQNKRGAGVMGFDFQMFPVHGIPKEERP